MMRIILLIFSLFGFSQLALAQVQMLPPIIFIDPNSKFGRVEVSNNADTRTELMTALLDAYPITDSLGLPTMKYVDSHPYSLKDYLRMYPKKVILSPRGMQMMKLSVSVPSDAPDGIYWTRIEVSGQEYIVNAEDTTTNVTAKLTAKTKMVNGVFYKKGNCSTELIINDARVSTDSLVRLKLELNKGGNSPYWGTLKAKLYNPDNDLVHEGTYSLPVYEQISRTIPIQIENMKPGNYRIEFEIQNYDDKIPEAYRLPANKIDREIEFTIN